MKMRNIRLFTFFLFVVCLMTNTYSQTKFSIHLGPSIPVLDFASDDIDDEDAGGAAVGLNVGLQILYPLSESGLGLYGGIDFNYNGLKKDLKDDVEDYYESMGIFNADFDFYKYINVPITIGLNYSYQADDKIGVYANAGLAFNILKVTDMDIKVNGQTITTEMETGTSIGYKIGGGILINQKTSISVEYFGLGIHDVDGEVKTTGYSENIDGEIKVDLLTLTLGISF